MEITMIKNMKKLFVIPVLIVLAIAAVLIFMHRVIFTGDIVKDTDQFTLSFQLMNKKDSHIMTLHEGDALSVDYAIDRGHADLFIGMEGEEEIYRGNDIGSGRFAVTVPKDGDYKITIDAKQASGYIGIYVQPQGK